MCLWPERQFTHVTSIHRPAAHAQWLWTRVTNCATWTRGEAACPSPWICPTYTGEACPWTTGTCAPRCHRRARPTSCPTSCAARPTLPTISTEAAARRTPLTPWSPPAARQSPRSTRWFSSGSTASASRAWRASSGELRMPVTTAMKQVNGDAAMSHQPIATQHRLRGWLLSMKIHVIIKSARLLYADWYGAVHMY